MYYANDAKYNGKISGKIIPLYVRRQHFEWTVLRLLMKDNYYNKKACKSLLGAELFIVKSVHSLSPGATST